jgi:hypothetical protein
VTARFERLAGFDAWFRAAVGKIAAIACRFFVMDSAST